MPTFNFNKLKGIKDLINKHQWKIFQRLTWGYTTGLSVSQGSILAPLHSRRSLSHHLLQCPHSTYHYMELSFYLATYSLLLLHFYSDAPSAKVVLPQ